VAHDFNNLLSVITNGLDLLRPIVKDAEGLGLIDSMNKAAMRGAALTNQLLTFARQQPVTPEPRELNRVIAGFQSVLRRATRSSVKFEIEVPGELPPVMIDMALFETALLNLVVNANDATLDGGSIRVTTHVSELREGQIGALPDGRYVVVSVQDTGSGMSDEVIARAIEPFFTTKAVGKGTGLGLSQVYGMVQQFGGELKITSQLAQGTTIGLYFPVSTEEAIQDSIPAPSDKVLIVDDQPDVLDMAAEMFRTLGFHVITATSGRQALEILSRMQDIHFLFSDVVMPGLSGVELGKKAQEISPDTRILLASGYTTPAGSLKGFEFLPKPYRMADILKKLRALG
jgi:CheY-like chemotaxis protein